jgi:hypothetical protein
MSASVSSPACAAAALPNAARRDRSARRLAVALSLAGLAGCSTAEPRGADAGAADPDGRASDAAPGADAEPADAAGPWRHTIAIDGVDDFAEGERFATTTAGHGARVTWDTAALYVGFQGADVAAAAASTWMFVYLDVDPGQGSGALVGEQYNSQRPSFAAGFGAEYYLRRQASGAVTDLKAFDGGGWTVALDGVEAARSGDFVELALPLAALGAGDAIDRLGVTIFWLNEADLAEWSYGGLYPDAFVDGYHAELAIGRWLELDRSAAAPPGDPGNARP